MTYQLKPITITREQIIAAAQKIANGSEDAWEYTSEQYLIAVRNFLEKHISDLVYDADWHARKEGFDGDYTGAYSVDFANELIMPEPPEWAHDTIDRAAALPEPRRDLPIEPDGDIIYA